MIVSNPATNGNSPRPASDSREHLFDLYLDARQSGNRELANEIRLKWRSSVVSYPVTESLSDESQHQIDSDLSRIKSDLNRGDAFDDFRFRADHSPVARSRSAVLFQVGNQDVKVKHQNINMQWSPSGGAGGGIRGKITKLSRKALARMKLHARNVPDGTFKAILTLTYPNDYTNDGKEVKRHQVLIKKWLQRHGCVDAFWFLEFQKRGAPHFHMLLKNWPVGGVHAVANAWHKIAGNSDKKHLDWHLGKLSGVPCLEWLRNPHAASAYVTKYASKKEQKDVPAEYQDVGRFWGYWGEARPVWRFVSGSGSYAVGCAWSVVMSARAAWDSDPSKFAARPMFSMTMWGGASAFDDLLVEADWVPF